MVYILIGCAPNLLFLFSCLMKSSIYQKKKKNRLKIVQRILLVSSVLVHWTRQDANKHLKQDMCPELNTCPYSIVSTATNTLDTIQVYIQIVSKCGINYKPVFYFLAFIYSFLKISFFYLL